MPNLDVMPHITCGEIICLRNTRGRLIITLYFFDYKPNVNLNGNLHGLMLSITQKCFSIYSCLSRNVAVFLVSCEDLLKITSVSHCLETLKHVLKYLKIFSLCIWFKGIIHPNIYIKSITV